MPTGRSNSSTTTVNTVPFGVGKERYLVFCVLWLVLAFVFIRFTAGNAFDYYRLRSRGILTDGTALAKAPHDGVTYFFKVNGAAYQGAGTAGFGTAPYGRIAVGDKLPIYYLPEDPKINCLGSPDKLLSNELPPLLGVVILFPTIIVARIVFLQKRNLRRSGYA